MDENSFENENDTPSKDGTESYTPSSQSSHINKTTTNTGKKKFMAPRLRDNIKLSDTLDDEVPLSSVLVHTGKSEDDDVIEVDDDCSQHSISSVESIQKCSSKTNTNRKSGKKLQKGRKGTKASNSQDGQKSRNLIKEPEKLKDLIALEIATNRKRMAPKLTLTFNTEMKNIDPDNALEEVNALIKEWTDFTYKNNDFVFERENLKDDLSYSCLVPVDEVGMSIGIFPSSNKLDRVRSIFHKSYSIRFEFPGPFAVLFDSNTLHYGKKSRNGEYTDNSEECVLEDRRAFMYIQQNRHINKDLHNTRSKTSVKPENDRVYGVDRPCFHLLNEWDTTCTICKMYSLFKEKYVDLEKLYSEELLRNMEVGTVVVGDLEEFGFIIFKSFEFDTATRGAVTDIQNQVKNSSESLTKQPMRRIAYPASSLNVQNQIDQEVHCLNQHLRRIVTELLHDKHIPNTCKMVKPNLIWNAGYIEFDQMAHFDYDESGRIVSYNEKELRKKAYLE